MAGTEQMSSPGRAGNTGRLKTLLLLDENRVFSPFVYFEQH